MLTTVYPCVLCYGSLSSVGGWLWCWWGGGSEGVRVMDRSGVWIRAHSCSKQAPGLQPPLSHPGVCRYVHTYIRTYVCCVYTYVLWLLCFWAYCSTA